MSDTFHYFPLSVDSCHYLPNVTTKKHANSHIAVLNFGQIFHAVSHSVLSVHISLPFTSSTSLSSSINSNHVIFFISVKFLFMLVASFCSFLLLTSSSSSSSYVVVFVVIAVFFGVVLVVVVVVIILSAVPAAVQQTFLSCYT